MKDKINVAVIGCGTIANAAHIPSYIECEKTNIKYFCDIIPERADGAVEKYGCGKAVYDYHEILDDPDLDAVSVCTHNDLHSVISIDFMKHGKDVISEKPAARVLDEAYLMRETARETGRILAIGVCNRYGSYVNEVKKYIEEGKLGEVFHVYASFRAPRSIPGIGGPFTTFAESGGGSLIDWGVHYIDLILYCCGEPKPLTASGEAFCKLGKNIPEYKYESMWAENTKDENGVYDVDDSVTGIVRTTGPVITFNGAWAQNIGCSDTFIDFMGDKGGIRMTYGGDFTYYTIEDGILTGKPSGIEKNNFFCDEICDFAEHVISREPIRNSIENAIATSEIMDAIYKSSETHREQIIG